MPSSRSAPTADNAFGFLSRETPSSQTSHPQLIRKEEPDTMLRAIKDELRRSESFVFSVAFIASSALGLLKQDLLDFAGSGTIITSTYLDFNDPDMFRELLVLPGIDVRVMEDGHSGFHTKGYVFRHPSETTAIVGSSNLTRTAPVVNQEWNLRF